MRRPNPDAHQTPTIQVIERMFALIDVLASREEPMALNCTLSAYRLGKDTLERDVAPRLMDAIRQIEVACGIQ